jgi:hypothetical protein
VINVGELLAVDRDAAAGVVVPSEAVAAEAGGVGETVFHNSQTAVPARARFR